MGAMTQEEAQRVFVGFMWRVPVVAITLACTVFLTSRNASVSLFGIALMVALLVTYAYLFLSLAVMRCIALIEPVTGPASTLTVCAGATVAFLLPVVMLFHTSALACCLGFIAALTIGTYPMDAYDRIRAVCAFERSGKGEEEPLSAVVMELFRSAEDADKEQSLRRDAHALTRAVYALRSMRRLETNATAAVVDFGALPIASQFEEFQRVRVALAEHYRTESRQLD